MQFASFIKDRKLSLLKYNKKGVDSVMIEECKYYLNIIPPALGGAYITNNTVKKWLQLGVQKIFQFLTLDPVINRTSSKQIDAAEIFVNVNHTILFCVDCIEQSREYIFWNIWRTTKILNWTTNNIVRCSKFLHDISIIAFKNEVRSIVSWLEAPQPLILKRKKIITR